ncbi:hypothetical protein EVAR_67325_1 [Eumeta japonica]|uniref:Uncharacterized protein n=1 Tax=Eumeta variegata TaxID=151549 RepID=A0A4C1TIB1_EUMVA|nr:hypothetical protein EVAR_67325_1 [Eumeta japonica]
MLIFCVESLVQLKPETATVWKDACVGKFGLDLGKFQITSTNSTDLKHKKTTVFNKHVCWVNVRRRNQDATPSFVDKEAHFGMNNGDYNIEKSFKFTDVTRIATRAIGANIPLKVTACQDM